MALIQSGSRRSVLFFASALLWSSAAAAQSREQRGVPGGDVQSWFLPWPLPAGAERYADIDGRRMLGYVVEQAEISRRYRDEVHPKFWGRIIGTSADAESAAWLAGKFRSAGLSDVRIQELDLLPQWFPRTYRVTVTAGGETRELVSAQPFYRSVGTPPGGLELEAVYVGLGSEADFIGRDVAGKAVFTYSMLGAPSEDAWRLAASKGAAVVFDAQMLPGNLRYQAYPSGTDIPAFALGGADGMVVRDLIVSAPDRVRVNVRLDVEMVPNLKTALVWGTLPGASDETIYLIAHRDGWFDAAGDNASGVASILGLAEHYAGIPRAERPRTIVFVGLDGHHNSGEGSGVGRNWMVDNRAQLFGKTALMINAEHPSTVQTTTRPRYMRGDIVDRELIWTNSYTGQQWYAGGPSRPGLERIALDAFREFGVTVYPDPNPRPPAGDLGRFYTFLPGVATSDFHHYFHTDLETPETVPWTGLEATTRAYARIIDEINELPLSALQRPEEPVN
jgi:hypothetical protein